MAMQVTRRDFLRRAGVAGAGLTAMLAGCQPAVVKETVVVEKEVEKVVKETVVVEKIVEAVPTRGPIQLVSWSLGYMNPEQVQWKPWQDAVLEIMRDKLPDVTVVNRDMGWDEVLRQNLVTGLLGGTAPDLIVNESFIQPYARMGAYLPLTDALTEAGIMDNLIPGVHENALTDGVLYGVSVHVATFAFGSNPQVAEKAGLDPNEFPTTWSQLLERCAAITKAGNGEYYGYAMQGPVGFLVGGIMRWYVYARCANAPMCKNNCMDPYFDDPKLEKVLWFLREINRYTPPGLTFDPDQERVYHQMHQGKTAYQVAWNGDLNRARQHGMENVVQYGLVPLPDEGGTNASVTVGNLILLGLSGTKHPAEATEFIKIVTMDEVTDFVYPSSGFWSPSTYSGLQRTLPKIDPQLKVHFDILQNADVGAMPQWPKAVDKVWAAFNDMMTKLFTTEEPIPQLQAEVQQAAEAAIVEA